MKKQLLAISIVAALGTSNAIAEENKDLTMSGEFGLILTSGNTKSTSARAGLTANQELEKWTNDYVVNALYKKEDSVKSAQKLFASAQGNYKLENPDNRIFVFGSYEDDEFSAYQYQGTLAAGWSQKVWDNEDSSFEYSIGPGYSFAKLQNDESVNGAILRGALSYRKNVSETSVFTQTFSTQVGSDNIKSRAESALTAQVAGNLSVKLSLRLDHNSDVQPGFKKLDTETAVTLVYTFL